MDSLEYTTTLMGLILDGESELPRGVSLDQGEIKIHHHSTLKAKTHEEGGFSTLTTISFSEHDFSLKSSLTSMITCTFATAYCRPLDNLTPTYCKWFQLHYKSSIQRMGFNTGIISKPVHLLTPGGNLLP